MGKMVIVFQAQADSCGQVAPGRVPEGRGWAWSRHSHDMGNFEKAK
jgi:hypothetical protein